MVDWGRKDAEINAFIYGAGTRDYPKIPIGQDGTGAGKGVEIQATMRLLRTLHGCCFCAATKGIRCAPDPVSPCVSVAA